MFTSAQYNLFLSEGLGSKVVIPLFLSVFIALFVCVVLRYFLIRFLFPNISLRTEIILDFISSTANGVLMLGVAILVLPALTVKGTFLADAQQFSILWEVILRGIALIFMLIWFIFSFFYLLDAYAIILDRFGKKTVSFTDSISIGTYQPFIFIPYLGITVITKKDREEYKIAERFFWRSDLAQYKDKIGKGEIPGRYKLTITPNSLYLLDIQLDNS